MLGTDVRFYTETTHIDVWKSGMRDHDDLVTDLLDRPTYPMGQVDRLLSLPVGTARRWIDGYERAGQFYFPLVRVEPSGSEMVTWGEFVETRLLANYRDRGVPIRHMRPAIERLRVEFNVLSTRSRTSSRTRAGKELVYSVQRDVALEDRLALVVARSNQYVLAGPAQLFFGTTEFGDEGERGSLNGFDRSAQSHR